MRAFAAFQRFSGLCEQLFRLVQTAVGLSHRGFDQAQSSAQAFAFAVETFDGLAAVQNAVADIAERLAGGMQRVVLTQERVMRHAQRLLDGLLLVFAGLTAMRGFFQRHLGLAHCVRHLQKRLFGGAFAFVQAVVAEQIQTHVQFAQRVRQRQIFLGHVGLLLQRRQVSFQFIQHVQNAHEVFVGLLQPSLGLFLARTEAADARRFLENNAPVLAALAEDGVDAALTDHRIAFLAHAGVAEEIDDVAQTAGSAVHQVFAVAAAVHAAGDRYFVKGHVQLMIGVVEHQRDFAVVERLALFGAVENNVRHAVAAQALGALFAQYPAHCVADVALAAAVGAHDARHVLREHDLRALGERFETVYLQFG